MVIHAQGIYRNVSGCGDDVVYSPHRVFRSSMLKSGQHQMLEQPRSLEIMQDTIVIFIIV